MTANAERVPESWGGKVKCPKPGVYRDVRAAAYHLWPAASSSQLGKLTRSPAHMKAYREQPPKETRALMLGRAIHVAVLEPREFGNRYARGPVGDRRTKAVKEAWADLRADRPDVDILKPADFDTCMAVKHAVYGKPRIARLLQGPGDIELSLVWDDEQTGVRCKARWDRHSPEIAGGTIVDLKTTRDASPRAFERSIFKFGYYRQGAHYLRAAVAHDAPVEHYAIVAVEKEPPYGVAAYRLREDAIAAGDLELDPLLKLYASCLETGEYPDYPDEVRDVALPPYGWGQVDERVDRLERTA